MPSLEGWRQLCIYFALAVHTDSVLVVTARSKCCVNFTMVVQVYYFVSCAVL